MLDEKDLQAIAQLMDAKLAPINDRLGVLEAVQAQMQADLTGVKATQTQMQDEIHLTNVRIELDIGKRLDALAEGQDVIMERLDALEKVKEKVEKISDKVDVIHAVVAQHSEDIVDLKEAK